MSTVHAPDTPRFYQSLPGKQNRIAQRTGEFDAQEREYPLEKVCFDDGGRAALPAVCVAWFVMTAGMCALHTNRHCVEMVNSSSFHIASNIGRRRRCLSIICGAVESNGRIA